MKHLETNGILHHCQHGFRHNHSCETQLISLVHDLTYNYDAGMQTDLISMDFAKAFDTVPHQRLMYKLQWYGVHGKVHKWISEFLTNCSQSCFKRYLLCFCESHLWCSARHCARPTLIFNLHKRPA